MLLFKSQCFDMLFVKEDVYVYYWSWGTERVSCNNRICSYINWVYYWKLDRKNSQWNTKLVFILFLHQWKGQNWMVGGNFQTSNRGIESDNLEFNFINNSWCVTDINLTQVPFRYLYYLLFRSWDYLTQKLHFYCRNDVIIFSSEYF